MENGRQALEAYLNAPDGTYDAILLDLRMPVMDGFEGERQLSAAAKEKVPEPFLSLACTSSSEDEVRSEAARAGFGAVLTKPINMEQLRGLLG
ncbi:MAG: response regulator [Enterocloster bolteae]